MTTVDNDAPTTDPTEMSVSITSSRTRRPPSLNRSTDWGSVRHLGWSNGHSDTEQLSRVGYNTQHMNHHHRQWRRTEYIQMRTWLLLTIFFLANVACVVVFAALYYAAGAECYTTDFSFMQMLWLSTHVFTTVGFGSISPDVCAGPQLLVLIEHFIAIIETALFTAIIITKLTQPQPKVRFSKNFIVNEDQDGSKWLVFRMVRESPHHLRDCKLNVCCGVVTREDGIVTGCSEEGLPLQCDHKSNLETWFVRHRIDDASPLSNERLRELAYMNVALTVFDTAHMQEVRIYHNYVPGADMLTNARFEVMKNWEMTSSTGAPPSYGGLGITSITGRKGAKSVDRATGLIAQIRHVVDHSKLDAISLLPV